MKTRNILAVLGAGALALALSGCNTANIPATGSAEESKYIVACSEAGGTFVPGSETNGTSYRSGCMFRYPALPTNN